MKTQTSPQSDHVAQPDSTLLLSDLITDAHHAHGGLDRFADALRTMAREDVHLASGKTFPQWALSEFDLPPALTQALLVYRPDDGSDQASPA